MNYLFLTCISTFLVSFTVAVNKKFCSEDVASCNKAKTNFTCVGASDAAGCTKDVTDGTADLTLASADNLVKYEDKLKIVYGQKLENLVKFVQYYGLAVVQKGATFNLNQLNGKKSCHTGVDKTVGWKIPVGYLLFTKKMQFTDNQYKSAADFFSESCAPGSKNLKDVSQEVKDDLCKLCNGTCAFDTSEPYSNYQGAFRCMAEGNNDRVGFVRQTTANAVITADPGKYGSASDYKLLCRDGKTKNLDGYLNCYMDRRPAYALVTNTDTPATEVKAMQDILTAANVTLLKTGKMVSSNFENFEPYTDTVKNYVGDYGDHYNALGGPNATASSAPSIVIALALQIIAIFAFVLLV